MGLVALALCSGIVFSRFAIAADGKSLYREHCAACHGSDGGGDGPLAKDLRFKPRAFKEGKFAFGNTPDAMVKTVMSGVPGQEVAQMPAFKAVLSDAEIHAVVEYVRTLMPALPQLALADMKMEVTDRAKVVRGILAPLAPADADARPIARGLLVGLPSGFSFEYATDDFRLLAVRRGGFVTRSDWEGRGGRPLTPLGEVIATVEHWRFAPQFSLVANDGRFGDRQKLEARLSRTHVDGARATLAYELVDAGGKRVAEVIETPFEEIVTGGAGFTQTFSLRALRDPVVLQFVAARLPTGVTPDDVARSGTAPAWHVLPRADGLNDCLMLRTDAPRPDGHDVGYWRYALSEQFADQSGTYVGIQPRLGDRPIVIRRTVITRKDVAADALAKMTTEIRP